MAHREIPIEFAFRTERRIWKAYSFVRGEAAPPRETRLPVLPLITLPPPTTSFGILPFPAKRETQICLRRRSSRATQPSDSRSYRIYGDEISKYLDLTLELQQLGLAVNESLAELLVAFPSSNAATREMDAWKMRDEFLRLDESNDALLNFLNRWGSWDQSGSLYAVEPTGTALRPIGTPVPIAILPCLVWERRQELREGMLSKPDLWLSNNAMLGAMQSRATYPYLTITDSTCAKAIETTITLDHLRKTIWRKCARPDCETVFVVESAHGKVYCEQYCGHLESLRRNRAKAKDAKKAAATTEA